MKQEDIARILEENSAHAFLCDSSYTLTAVSPALSSVPFPPRTGQKLADLFASFPEEYPRAREQLEHGAPFYSTKFELLPQKVALFLLPLLEEDRLKAVYGCFLPREDGGASPVLAVLSDRYRSPATGLYHILSMFASKFQAAEDYRSLRYLNEAARYCYDILRSSTAVHDYAQLVNGQMKFLPRRTALNDFASNLCDTLRLSLRNTHYRLLCEVCRETAVVNMDEQLMSLALFHIIANACRFSPADSAITLRLTLRGESACLTVSDEGSGIPAQNLDRIFEPFFTDPHGPVAEEDMGLGLGLPIAQRIAELHGGRLLVTSGENRGTSVALTLPVAEETSSDMILHADTARYITDRFSPLYVLFSRVLNLDFF